MDDTAQSPGQVGQQTVSQPPVSQPSFTDTQGVQQATVPQQPAQGQDAQQVSQEPVNIPVGGKEHEAVGVGGVQPTQPEVAISQEVKEAGVEAAPAEEPQLSQEHKDAGLEAVKEATPLPSGPTKVQLPDDYKAPKSVFSLLGQHAKNAATWLYLLLFKVEEQKALQHKPETHEPLVETHDKKNV